MFRSALLVVPALLLSVPAMGLAQSSYSEKSYKTGKKKSKKARMGTSAFVSPATPSQALPTFTGQVAPAAATSGGGATIMAYKRDPVPIFDATGSKLRDVPKGKMPKVNTAAARVLGTKPGYVQIMLDGAPAWLRLTAVDYVGTISTPPCEKVVTKFAKMEEDGVERSLGLGCKK